MDPERQRIQDDLRGLVQGEVRCDDVFVKLYASDASVFELDPIGVVRPRTTSDVAACLHYARENGLAIHPRGAGTGVAGGCLGRGLVLDFAHSMHRIMDTDSAFTRVQAGVVLANLNRSLARSGRTFGPAPVTAAVTTMGSVASVNRSGSHWPKYGSARDRVVSMEVVLADGEVVELSQHTSADEVVGAHSHRVTDIVQQVASLIERNKKVIEVARPKSLVNSSGYLMYDVLQNDQLNLAKLLVGSEGTLGIITELTLATDPLPKHRGAALLFFDRVEKAANAACEIRHMEVSACDLIDRRLLSLARESDLRYDALIPAAAEAVLLVEVDRDEIADVKDRLNKLSHWTCRKRKLAFDAVTSVEKDDLRFFCQLAYRILPTLYRLSANMRPLPFVEDIAVPPDKLAEFILQAQNVLKHHQTTASLFAHAAHGHLHLRPFLDLAKPADILRMKRIANDLYQLVTEMDGTISGDHGNGLSRSWFVRREFPELHGPFEELKRIFDPENVLNPGKITSAEPLQLTKSLRPVVTISNPLSNHTDVDAVPPPMSPLKAPETVELMLNWNTNDLNLEARSCNGCGACRTQSDIDRMCPIFRFAPAEEASPRAKANLMRHLFSSEVNPDELADDELKRIADLCVNCHQCRDECPAGVDIPKLMIEYKAQYVATNGIAFSDWLLSRTDILAQWGTKFTRFANFAIGNRRMRWALERLTGIAQSRKLPRIEKRSFIQLARRQQLTKPTRGNEHKILYFTDLYANWFDVQLANAAVSVFQHNGIEVFVPPSQVQSGMSLLAVGAVEKARTLASRNVAILAEAVHQGYHIVTAEPSAALCLTHDYPNLLQGEDVDLVSANTSEACSYLFRMHQTGRLELDFKPLHMTVGYHQPCHSRALGNGLPAMHLLALIPGLSVRHMDQGCSGMAGTYGLKKENYRNSLRAGWPLISTIRDPQFNIGVTECSTCKMQMEQGTRKPTVHPLKLLAYSYGLMPEIADKLTVMGKDLYIS